MPVLAGLKVALLIANGFSENEFAETQRALLKTGAVLKTISTEKTLANGWLDNAWGHYFPVDQHISDTLASDFDAIVLPGGSRSTAKLAQNPHIKRILGHFFDADKPIAAFNEGVSLLVMPGKLEGRSVAGDRTDPQWGASGATLVEGNLAVDGNLMTIQSTDAAELVGALLNHFGKAEELAAA